MPRRAPMLLVALSACSAQSGTGAIGTSSPETSPEPIELALLTVENEYVDLTDYHGQPVVLFLFATWDTTSQAALHPISRFARAHPETRIIGIAVQPDARLLLDAWVYSLEPPFVATYESDDRIASGTSPLGAVTVPMFIVLDRSGVIVARRQGLTSERDLARIIEQQVGPASKA